MTQLYHKMPTYSKTLTPPPPPGGQVMALKTRGRLAEVRELTDSALGKLQAMSDAEFAELELYPDFDE